MNFNPYKPTQRYSSHSPAALQWFVAIVLAIGITLRFVNLDLKVYAHDEVYTSMRVSGYVREEVEATVANRIVTVAELLQFQEPGDRTWGDTVRALATHPEHPPLFYLLERAWISLFGSSIASFRALPAAISLLAFPALYWLCIELFRAPTTGWVAIALLAVSPYHVLFAQEARQYSLWTVLTLVSSAALLRGMRTKSPRMWLLYGVSTLLNFYTALLAPLLVFAHALYLLIVEKGRLTKVALGFGLATIAAGIGFLPWLFVVFSRWGEFQSKTYWLKEQMSLPLLAKFWGLHIKSPFIDFPIEADSLLGWGSIVVGVVLVVLAFGQLIRQAPLRVWLFPLSVVSLAVLPLVLSDVLQGGMRSSVTRYFDPAMVMLVVVVADLLARWLLGDRGLVRRVGALLLCGLLTCGVVSSMAIATSDVWWNKFVSYEMPTTARFLNQFSQPYVISGTDAIALGNLISLSYMLPSEVQLSVAVGTVPSIPEWAEDVFLFYPSDRLKEQLHAQENFDVVPVEEEQVNLYQIKRVP